MDMMSAVLRGVVLPGAAAFVLLLPLRWPRLPPLAGAALGAAGAAAAYWLGSVALFGMPRFLSPASIHWIPTAALAAALSAVLLAGASPRAWHGWLRAAVAGGALVGIGAVLARGILRNEEFPWPGLGLLVLGGAMVALYAAPSAVGAKQRRGWAGGPALAMLLALQSGALGVGLLFSGSARLSQMTGITGAILGALVVLALLEWKERRPATLAAEGALGSLLAFHLLLAAWYSELPVVTLTGVLAMQGAALALLIGESRGPGRLRTAGRIFGAAAFLLGLAMPVATLLTGEPLPI